MKKISNIIIAIIMLFSVLSEFYYGAKFANYMVNQGLIESVDSAWVWIIFIMVFTVISAIAIIIETVTNK